MVGGKTNGEESTTFNWCGGEDSELCLEWGEDNKQLVAVKVHKTRWSRQQLKIRRERRNN